MDGTEIFVIVIVILIFAGSIFFKIKFSDNVDTQENEKKSDTSEKLEPKPVATVNNSKKKRRKK